MTGVQVTEILTMLMDCAVDKLLDRLAVEDRRAGHLRHQYLDRHGHVIVSDEEF